MLLCAASCTHNDGDIGDLYGRWQVQSIQTGDAVTSPDDIFFSFQSQVVFTSYSHYDLHEAQDFRGTYRHDGDSLFLTYYTTDEYADKVTEFMSGRLGFADFSNVRLHIDHLSHDRLILSADGNRWLMRKF